MASTINASSSGSGGLISTGDASGVLQLQTNGSIALAIDTSKRVGIGASPANNNNPLQAYYTAAGNIASISITNTDTSSDYSHAGLYMEAKNGAVYGSIFTDKANALLRLGYNTTGATLGINGSGNIASFGGQITFPASQSASSDPNTLDDYEEGTWTPVIAGSSSTSGQTYLTQSGKYTKIGRVVTLTALVELSNKGTITGTYVNITGFPFALMAGGSSAGSVNYWSALNSASFLCVGLYADSSVSYGYMTAGKTTAANIQYLSPTDITNTTAFILSITYQTAT